MRNLKKVLALALALVMCLSLMTVANAFTDDKDVNATYEEAIEVLTGLGVLKGYTDGSFQPKGEITRAEVAAVIYRIVTGDVNDEQVKIYSDYARFDDVKSTAWYAGYVGYCANAEYIKGYGDNTFGPNDLVTGYQALAMILRAMGYDVNGEFTGSGWEIRVASTAQGLDILKNVKEGTLGTAATRELVAELIFQAILKPTVVYTPALGYYTADLLKDVQVSTSSLGAKTFGLHLAKGVITANEKADLYSKSAATAGTTILDKTALYTLSTDESLIGHLVTFYATGANKALTTPKDQALDVSDLSNLAEAPDKFSAVGYELFYNYEAANAVKFGKGIEVKKITNGGTYPNYILVVEKTFAEVQYITTAGAITLNNTATVGKQQPYDGIAVGDKVLVVSYDGNAWIEKAEYVTGYISGYTYSKAVQNVTIGGEKYEKSALVNSTGVNTFGFTNSEPATYEDTYNGKTWDYFLDNYGNIIAYDYASELAVEYALILDFDVYSTGPWAKDLWVKYLTVDGEVVTDIVDEHTSVDFSEEHNKGDVVEYRLNDDGEFVVVNNEILKTYPGQNSMVAIDPTYEIAYVHSGENFNGLYTVNDDFVAFYYDDGYYGVLTGAAAIADLSVNDLAAIKAHRVGKQLAQVDYTEGNKTHTDYIGSLQMVNIKGRINAETQFCYIADTETVIATTAVDQGNLYYYSAVAANGEKIQVAVDEKLNAQSPNVWAYQQYTANYARGGSFTFNKLTKVETLGYTVLYGDLHSGSSKTFYVYNKNNVYPTPVNLPSFIANAKGGEAKLDSYYCATGYVVADTTLVDLIEKVLGMGDYGYELLDGETTGTTIGSLANIVVPDAKAVFVTEAVDNDHDYVDVTVTLPNSEEEPKHLPVGFKFDEKLLDEDLTYNVTIEYTDNTENYEKKDVALKDIPAVKLNWKSIKIEAYECAHKEAVRENIITSIRQPSKNIICYEGLTGYTSVEAAVKNLVTVDEKGATAVLVNVGDAFTVTHGIFTNTADAKAATDATLTGTTGTDGIAVSDIEGNIVVFKITASDGVYVYCTDCDEQAETAEAVYVAVKFVQ